MPTNAQCRHTERKFSVFKDEVIRSLIKNGTMKPKVLFDAPFTHINTKGVAGIFGDEGGKEVIEPARKVNDNAGTA